MAPPFADSITEGDVRWDKEIGDSVQMDEVIGEIETDKTALPIQAPCAGVIEEFLVEDGATINKGAQLVVLNTSGGGAKPAPKAQAPPAAPAPEPVSPPPPPPPAATVTPPPAPLEHLYQELLQLHLHHHHLHRLLNLWLHPRLHPVFFQMKYRLLKKHQPKSWELG